MRSSAASASPGAAECAAPQEHDRAPARLDPSRHDGLRRELIRAPRVAGTNAPEARDEEPDLPDLRRRRLRQLLRPDHRHKSMSHHAMG
jgi:hypothetical protein